MTKQCRVEKFLHRTDLLYISHCSCGEICHVETFLQSPHDRFHHIAHFAPHLSCGELFPCDRFSSHFSCGETSPHDNLSYRKISPHGRFFSTSTACDACDKYQVCSYNPTNNLIQSNYNTINHIQS